jgi:transposase InsO family protein
VRELEEGLAAKIEAVLLRDEGVDLGLRTRRDGVDESGLTVDFTYDEAGHALEVTTTPDAGTPAAVAAAKLADRLSEVASGWIIVVSDKATMRDLDVELLGLIATGVGVRPGEYGSADIDQWIREHQLDQEMERRRRLAQLGVVELVRQPEIDGVEAMVIGDLRTFDGATTPLAQAVQANTKKLAACGRLRTHLVVGLAEFGVSRDPGATEVAELPDAIDDLWVVQLWKGPGEAPPIWHARRGDTTWTLHEEPGSTTEGL